MACCRFRVSRCEARVMGKAKRHGLCRKRRVRLMREREQIQQVTWAAFSCGKERGFGWLGRLFTREKKRGVGPYHTGQQGWSTGDLARQTVEKKALGGFHAGGEEKSAKHVVG